MGPEMRAYLHDLNELYRNHPALYAMDGNSDGFEWIQFTSYDENVVAFLRKTESRKKRFLRCVIFHRYLMTVTGLVCLLRGNIRKFSTVTVKSLADRVW